MDRIDIHTQVLRVEFQKLRDMRSGESSAEVRVRVEAACERQRGRFTVSAFASNADMHPPQIRKYCVLDDACQALMKTAMRQLQLTARAYHRVLKLSRTIADLAHSQPDYSQAAISTKLKETLAQKEPNGSPSMMK